MVKVEYHMINGENLNGYFHDVKCRKGEFIFKTSNKSNGPEGMFRVSKADEKGKKIILEQIDCGFVFVKEKGIGTGGPNKNCMAKCKYVNKCPIKDYALLLKSGFE